jgi:hypothetical protein
MSRLRLHPERGQKGRPHSTAILYLLKAGDVSCLHRVDKSGTEKRATNIDLAQIGSTASIRRRSCRQRPGRPPAASGAGR